MLNRLTIPRDPRRWRYGPVHYEGRHETADQPAAPSSGATRVDHILDVGVPEILVPGLRTTMLFRAPRELSIKTLPFKGRVWTGMGCTKRLRSALIDQRRKRGVQSMAKPHSHITKNAFWPRTTVSSNWRGRRLVNAVRSSSERMST